MKRNSAPRHGYKRFGFCAPHNLNNNVGFRGGVRL